MNHVAIGPVPKDVETILLCPKCGSDDLIINKKNAKLDYTQTICICRKCWKKGWVEEFEVKS